MAFLIRRATLADLPALIGLERNFPGDRLGRNNFRHLLTRAHADVWVGVADGTPVANAVVLFRKNSTCARLYSLVVAPSTRGRGIAGALVRTLELAASARGCNRVRLEVRDDNAVAARLYTRLGYRFVRRVPAFYEDGHDALRLDGMLDDADTRDDLAA